MRVEPRSLGALVAVAALLTIAGCSSTDEGPSFYTGDYAHTLITLSPSILSPGDTGWAHLMAVDENFTPLGELATTWSGDASGVATVDSSGRIVAVAEGQETLTAASDPNAFGWSLYVSPAAACGQALDVSTWLVQGGFTWHGTAAGGDTSVATHHAAAWTLHTGTPRQVNSGEIVWSIQRPTAESFSFSRRDTLTVGAAKYVDQGNAAFADSVQFWGEVRLQMSGCKLTADLYPWTLDGFAKVRPGLPDSLFETDLTPVPLSSAELAVGTITGGATRTLGGNLPVMLTTDADLPLGYAPTGYASYVAYFKGEGVDSIALVQDLTPGYYVPSLSRHR